MIGTLITIAVLVSSLVVLTLAIADYDQNRKLKQRVASLESTVEKIVKTAADASITRKLSEAVVDLAKVIGHDNERLDKVIELAKALEGFRGTDVPKINANADAIAELKVSLDREVKHLGSIKLDSINKAFTQVAAVADSLDKECAKFNLLRQNVDGLIEIGISQRHNVHTRIDKLAELVGEHAEELAAIQGKLGGEPQ
jgi:hypothetical protein